MPIPSRSVSILGIETSVEEYDDDQMSRAYVLRFHFDLATAFERRLFCTIPMVSTLVTDCDTSDPHAKKARRLYMQLEDEHGHVADEDILNAFNSGRLEELRANVVERIVALAKGRIRRCPTCKRIARTPKALQCPWCLCRWRPHGSASECVGEEP